MRQLETVTGFQLASILCMKNHFTFVYFDPDSSIVAEPEVVVSLRLRRVHWIRAAVLVLHEPDRDGFRPLDGNRRDREVLAVVIDKIIIVFLVFGLSLAVGLWIVFVAAGS